MDAAAIFRQGLGSVIPRPPPQHLHQQHHHQIPRGPIPGGYPVHHHHLPLHPLHPFHPSQQHRDDVDADNRIAHTLTACCRCRQRKTRCDPTLPRCLPCERSGSICEYFDTTKGKKISRSYVVKLQAKVKQLEAQLAQFTDDDEFPGEPEDMVRPGGLVRLDDGNDTGRYLGPSSGIAMTRLLMEEAKRFTESKRISELIPEVRARRTDRVNRMSISYGPGSISGPAGRKKSYPMISAHAAEVLPARNVADKLVDIFNQRAQAFTPTLHEPTFAKDLDEVFNGTTDPHKNFMVRMVMAISLQKLEPTYAGLADSYYLAAMQYFEDVVRPKDLRTLQCLILLGQYSLLTPTRTAVYYIIGLATRICQQLGLADEKTIMSGYSLGLVDPLMLDMRRRLSWIVLSMELGLAHSMGRPNGFSKGDDLADVGFFDVRADEDITAEGINEEGAPSEKKLVAIHFCRMRLLQAEIRRTLYEKKRHEPRDENHPWFAQMEQKIHDWLNSAPENPTWCRPWFSGRFHTMIVGLFRPSPQVPKPSARAALTCFSSAAVVVDLSSKQAKSGAIDITWVFLLTVYMSLNTLLWSVSYAEVRRAHSREQLEQYVAAALEIIDQCADRWPGTDAASQHYSLLARACLQSYEIKEKPLGPPVGHVYNNFATPTSMINTSSPSASDHSVPGTMPSGPPQVQQMQSHPQQQQQQQQPPMFTNPQFGYVFENPPQQPQQSLFNFSNGFDNSGADAGPGPGDFPPRHPQFRTNSIFFNPSSTEPGNGRRPSCFPPDFSPDEEGHAPHLADEPTPPATSTPHAHSAMTSPPLPNTLPTPPEAGPGAPHQSLSPPITMIKIDPRSVSPTPTMPPHQSPTPPMGLDMTPVPAIKFEPNTPQSTPRQQQAMPIAQPQFAVPPLPHHQQQHPGQHHQPQRPLPSPTTVTDWFRPPPPFISPFTFSSANGGNNGGNMNGDTAFLGDPGNSFMSGVVPGYQGGMPGPGGVPGQFAFPLDPMRQGSLTQEQLTELLGVLETDGLSDINQFLSMGPGGGVVDAGPRW